MNIYRAVHLTWKILDWWLIKPGRWGRGNRPGRWGKQPSSWDCGSACTCDMLNVFFLVFFAGSLMLSISTSSCNWRTWERYKVTWRSSNCAWDSTSSLHGEHGCHIPAVGRSHGSPALNVDLPSSLSLRALDHSKGWEEKNQWGRLDPCSWTTQTILRILWTEF